MNAKLDYDGDVVAGRNYPFTVVAELGLAARPSAIIARAIQQMTGESVMGNDVEEKNARSIMGIMTLGMGYGYRGYLRFSDTQPAAPLRALREEIRMDATSSDSERGAGVTS